MSNEVIKADIRRLSRMVRLLCNLELHFQKRGNTDMRVYVNKMVEKYKDQLSDVVYPQGSAEIVHVQDPVSREREDADLFV